MIFLFINNMPTFIDLLIVLPSFSNCFRFKDKDVGVTTYRLSQVSGSRIASISKISNSS